MTGEDPQCRVAGYGGEPLRIVHLITGLEAGGAERMLTRVATGSDQHRFTSLVISMTTGGAMEAILTGARIESAAGHPERFHPDPGTCQDRFHRPARSHADDE